MLFCLNFRAISIAKYVCALEVSAYFSCIFDIFGLTFHLYSPTSAIYRVKITEWQ